MFKAILISLAVAGASAGVNEVRMENAPVKFQTVLDPVSAGCKNPTIDSERSGVYQLNDSRFGVLVIFDCGKEDGNAHSP